jgi:predicted membrane channel-forming protein YqfA (hemolysin III family)
MPFLTAPASFGHTDCERIVGGVLAQPVLAVTSLAYVIVGMVVLFWAVRVRAPLAGVAAVTLVAVGAGSFAFHGPQPSWAGLAHDLPIVVVGVVYAAGLVLSARRQRWSAWVAPAGVFALALAAYAAGRSGSPLCRPDSLFQYHAAWHVLTAAAAGLAARAMAPASPVINKNPRSE